MPNIGHILIEATGSPQDPAALAAHGCGTARGGSAFTLSALMRPDPAPDHAVRWTETKITDTMVSLSIEIARDRDALGAAARIAGRFPTLRIVAVFAAECHQTAFDALCFAKGRLACQAHFDDGICFPVLSNGPDERRASLVRFFQRTPARNTAALDRFDGTALAQVTDRPAVAGAWRDVFADGMEIRVWWHPDAADGTGQALVARDGAFTLLTGVDSRGGYGHEEKLDAEAVARRVPDPPKREAQRNAKHLRDAAAPPRSDGACTSMPPTGWTANACKPAAPTRTTSTSRSEQASAAQAAAAAGSRTCAGRRHRPGCLHPAGLRNSPGATSMATPHRIARAIDDGLFDRVFQPLLDRTGWNPAWLGPGLIGAAFAAAIARVLLLCGAGQLAAHVFDAGLSVAAMAATYRLSLRHAASVGTPGARRSSGIYMALRLAMLAVLHLQLLQVAVVGSPPADMACLALGDALFVAGLYVGACKPPRPWRRRAPQPAQAPIRFTS